MRRHVLVLMLSCVWIVALSAMASAAWQPYVARSVGEGNTITIDGDLSDWHGISGITLGTDPAQVVRGTWDGPQDSSGTFYLQWTKDYLLLAADVTDDVGLLSPGRIDNGDSVGLTIDIFNGSRPDVHPFLVEVTPYPPGGNWDEAVLFRHAVTWQHIGSSNTIVRAQEKDSGNGYYLEAAIPFSDLTQEGKTLDPVADRSVFFSLILTDSDGNSSRKSVLLNTRTEANPVADWFRVPVEFTSLIFRGDGSGQVKIGD